MNIGSEGDGHGQFQVYRGLCLQQDGHLLATDAAHAWVQVFDQIAGKFMSRFGGKGDQDTISTSLKGSPSIPTAISSSPTTAPASSRNTTLLHWLKTFSEYGSEPGQNMMSEFMDIQDGRLYVPDIGNHRVNVFDLDGNPLFNFGESGSATGELNNPEAAKASSDGQLYVTDLKNNRMQVFDREGKFLLGGEAAARARPVQIAGGSRF